MVHADKSALAEGRATGIVFQDTTVAALTEAVTTALQLYARPRVWRKLMLTAMAQDYSWERSAAAYRELYQQAITADR